MPLAHSSHIHKAMDRQGFISGRLAAGRRPLQPGMMLWRANLSFIYLYPSRENADPQLSELFVAMHYVCTRERYSLP